MDPGLVAACAQAAEQLMASTARALVIDAPTARTVLN